MKTKGFKNHRKIKIAVHNKMENRKRMIKMYAELVYKLLDFFTEVFGTTLNNIKEIFDSIDKDQLKEILREDDTDV